MGLMGLIGLIELMGPMGRLLAVAEFVKDIVGYVDFGRGKDNAGIGCAVEDQAVALGITDVLDGVVYLVLYGCHEAFAFFEEFAIGAEILLFKLSSFLLLRHDGLFALLLLLCAKENCLALVCLEERLGFCAECLNLGLPFA